MEDAPSQRRPSDSVVELWEIFVPTARANGRPIRTRHHRAWDAQVQKITGGLTIIPPVIGKWISPDTNINYKDRMIPVRIACTSEQMREIMKRTLNHYPDEECIMAYKISSEVRMAYRA